MTDGIMELWIYGIMELWNYGITELWNYEIMELWKDDFIFRLVSMGNVIVTKGWVDLLIDIWVHELGRGIKAMEAMMKDMGHEPPQPQE